MVWGTHFTVAPGGFSPAPGLTQPQSIFIGGDSEF